MTKPERLSLLVANYLGPKPCVPDIQSMFPRCRWCGLEVKDDAVPAKGVENRVAHRKCEADHDAFKSGVA